ncbi:MAG: flagellar basal body P-ring formation protein FlgA [Magnetococcales bacterium]|nr:flagellar basal body P-ring formation protein FlgA [Magnetococcales bacterium]
MGVDRRGMTAGWLSGLMIGLMTLSAQAQVIQNQTVISESERQIRALLEAEKNGLRLDRVFFRDELRLPDGRLGWKIKPKAGELKPGRQSIPVEVSVNGNVATVLQVSVSLKQPTRYLVMSRPLKRGEVVRESDLQWEESELERPPAGLLDDPKRIAGQTANRQILADRPLQSEWFSAPMVVARGERVQVAAVRGALRIEATAIAQAAGRVGDTVVMENPASHRRFDARITGPGHAEVTAW